MREQTQKWWVDDKIHYTYLGLSIVFLIIIHLIENQGLLIHILLVVHLILLIGKFYFNSFLMELIFGIRARKESKRELYERTIKFEPHSKAQFRNGNNSIYKRQNGVEDVLFGINRDTSNRYSHYNSLYESKYTQQQRPLQNEQIYPNNQRNYYERNQDSYLQSNNLRDFYDQNQTRLINNTSPYNNIKSFDQSNIRVRPFQNLETFPNTSPNYDNLDRRPSETRNLTNGDNNYNLQNRYRQAESSMFQRFPDRGGNLNSSYKRRLQEEAINRSIAPLEKQFMKYNISKAAAINMIFAVRKYFDQRLKQYKNNEADNFKRLRLIMNKILLNNDDQYSIESLIMKAKQLLRSPLETTFFPKKKQLLSELENVMSQIYFEGISSLNTKTELLRFYKEQTVRNVLEGINLQIITYRNNGSFTQNIPQFTYYIYHVLERDFCCFHRDQENHSYNIDETFLLLILACKNLFPTSQLIREIMSIANLRNAPIIY